MEKQQATVMLENAAARDEGNGARPMPSAPRPVGARSTASAAARSPRAQAKSSPAARTLAIDIGGSGIKAEVLDANGKSLSERARLRTPRRATPRALVAAIETMARSQGAYDRVSVGFPGVVKDGVVETAPNLGPRWQGCNLAKLLHQRLHRPVRVANDAAVQGLGAVRGRGVEMVLTLGTGVGSALFVDGRLVPNLEFGHHPFRKRNTYEDELSHAALLKVGKKRWNKRLLKAIETLAPVFNYRMLYLGGGNSKFIKAALPRNVKVISNLEGILGGVALWRD
jgi:polyphosphate glucokinase